MASNYYNNNNAPYYSYPSSDSAGAQGGYSSATQAGSNHHQHQTSQPRPNSPSYYSSSSHQQQASPSYYAAQPQVSLQDPSSSYHDPLDAYHHHPAAASTTSMSYLAPSQDDHGGYGSGRPSYSRDRLISNAQAMPMSELQPGQTIATPYAAGGGGGGSVYSNVSSYASTARAGAHGYPPPPQQQQMMGGNSPYAWQGGANLRGPVHGGGWGIAREQMLKRRDVRQVELKEGNLVLDIPVPEQIVPPGNKTEEMNKMRYTAATCDPDDFLRSKYTLRPFLYGRKTELFIVMTMYNEDEILFLRTMNSVIKNITHLCDRSKSKTWGHDGWKKVVVCVVSDGRKPCNARTLKVLTLMGAYAEGVAKDHVGDKEVTAHIFEVTTQSVVSEAGDVSIGAVPIQLLFCLKEANKKKLNSHRWFFNAFGPILNPEICVLLDVGTKPSGTSIYELWKCFDKHPGVGGCCGEICVDRGRGCSNLINPLVAAQEFEYKMSNILDKPLESVCGYISVLPGAFSAYRYKALQNDSHGRGPLASYFLGEKMHSPGADAGIFQRNMYLAEDRILCFEIVTKKKEAWTLQYVKSAKASTDVPNRVPEFISQRRRWLNGSLFAAVHATMFFFKIWTSGQGFFRKLILQLEFIYMAVNLFFNWFSLSSYYLAFFFLLQSATGTVGALDPFFGAGKYIFQIFSKLYIVVIFVILVCSLGNRPQGSNVFFTGSMVLFAILQLMLLYCAGWTVYNAVPHTAAGWEDIGALFNNPTFRDIVISLGATYGLYLVSSLMHLEPWHLLTAFVQYLLLLPSFVNILMIYSMCNLHDVSWGTKGSTTVSDLGAAKLTKKDGKDVLEVAIPTNKDDISEVWLQARGELRVKPEEHKDKRAPDVKQSDNDRNYRTNVVLLFLGSNIIPILLFTSDFFLTWLNVQLNISSTNFNPYLAFIFYSVAGLSAIRFIGSALYLIFRLVGF